MKRHHEHVGMAEECDGALWCQPAMPIVVRGKPDEVQVKYQLAFGLISLFSLGAHAQNVVHTDVMMGQPLQYMHEGRVSGCGLRIIATRMLYEPMVESSEVSVNIYASGRALVKAVAYSATSVRSNATPKVKRVASAWIKAAGGAATPVIGKPQQGDDRASIIFATDFDVALDIISAPSAGKTIQIAVRRAGENSEFILAGTVALDAAQEEQMVECFTSLAADAQK